MKAAKRKRLERAGWRLTSTEEFLELSDEEKVLVGEKLARPTQLAKSAKNLGYPNALC